MVMHMPYTNDVIQNGTEKSNEPRKKQHRLSKHHQIPKIKGCFLLTSNAIAVS